MWEKWKGGHALRKKNLRSGKGNGKIVVTRGQGKRATETFVRTIPRTDRRKDEGVFSHRHARSELKR